MKQRAPRIADLQAEIGALEASLEEARREQQHAKTSLPSFIASGDAEEIAACRKVLRDAEKTIAERSATLEETREALQVAVQTERAAARERACREIERALAADRKRIGALAEAIVTACEALEEARAGLEQTDATLINWGLIADPYQIRARLLGLVQLALHVESGGLLGQARTIESIDELKRSGRADLKAAASEYAAVTLRRVRGALSV